MDAESSASSVHGGAARNINKGYQNDILNPYFMHPNENPSLILVTPLLSGNNYHSWSRSMIVSLISKNKLYFINGSLPRPSDDDHDSFAWDICNTMDRYYQGDVFRISDIQEEICTLKQGDSSISSYYTKLKKLWKELDNFRPIPVCECDITCAAITKIRQYKDGDQVIRFLKGLNEQYTAVRAQIMLMDPLSDITKVYSLLVQQERHAVLKIDESKLLFTPANNSQSKNGPSPSYNPQGRGSSSSRGRGQRGGRSTAGRGRGNNNKVCTYCGMTNHVVDDCFKKYGFPPHWQHNGAINNYASNQSSPASSYLLQVLMHKAILALLQGSSSATSHNVNQIITKPHKDTCIICTLPNHKTEDFILDSSATDHVCFC
ncbi:hypothetical protein TSUD_279410 [Trifolium subterraneum]|uniref:Retrotransposon Copia-like N-terminal domain-containing protein n=1 Tax=Trifolium subterraneum TaxID=3900 RepID=A0A2Z6NTA7_TRISU|nr:hypothetical protein TSUD_279410 [Trifolium subterraneum]